MGRRRPGTGAASAGTTIRLVAAVATLVITLGACSGGGADDEATVTDAGAGAGADDGGEPAPAPDEADGASGTGSPSPTDGGDGVAPMMRTVDVPCPAELGYLTSRSGESCYQLGESGGLGTDIIDSASVELSGGYWEIQLVMTDAGLARFNGLAAECIAESPTCPTGRVAFVAERAVVSTATITKSDYQSDEVMVTGRFSAADARAIAEALDP